MVQQHVIGSSLFEDIHQLLYHGGTLSMFDLADLRVMAEAYSQIQCEIPLSNPEGKTQLIGNWDA